MADSKKAGKQKRGSSKRARTFKKTNPKWKVELAEIQSVVSRYNDLGSIDVTKFTDLPLSKRTRNGLKGAGYSVPTDIQRESIPVILNGKDVLGAAKTGSGKTLAFLIPLLELLWRERWSSDDGLGALVISPTRELAYQTFEVLRAIGSHHDFSAGLVIGGKDFLTERTRIQNTNIVICTPGRLLQHLDETAHFDCSSLKLLILDEADRILDLGFRQTMNSVIENLPVERQTLLFSATQTKSVRDLARLSLKSPEYIAVHENSKTSTPHKLSQSYIVCELPEKLCVLYSFIRSHTSSKVIVFMSSCKQVKYVYEAFRRLRPGIPLMAMYGRQKQPRRVGIYNDFCHKKYAVLLCTDIAARGLDFPAVHWVVQLDCPEDAITYIHRVGRTARYEKDGNALIILLPSEEQGMLETLKAKKIPVEQIRVNPKKMVSIQKQLEIFCAQDSEMKHWAQRSFICYLRSVHLQSDKTVFDIHQLPTDKYSHSLGLAQPPRIRFLQKLERESLKEQEEMAESDKSGEETDGEDSVAEEDLLTVKRVIQPVKIHDGLKQLKKAKGTSSKVPTKVTVAKKLLNKKIRVSTHIKFEEKSDQSDSDTLNVEEESIAPVSQGTYQSSKAQEGSGIKLEEARISLQARDSMDRKRERARVKATHREQRRKTRSVTAEKSKTILRLPSVDQDSESGEDQTPSLKEPVRKRIKIDFNKENEEQLGVEPTPVTLVEDEELVLHLLNS